MIVEADENCWKLDFHGKKTVVVYLQNAADYMWFTGC